MSSIIGHALTAGAIYACGAGPSKEPFIKKGLWFGCLLLAAIAPDLDYFVGWLDKSGHNGLRISNSIAFSLVVPIIITVLLVLLGVRGAELRSCSLQLVLAGLSHILLDFCVGVHPLPLFWPLYDGIYHSPIGLLPSAGAVSLTNYYLYRNLLIELGILIPLYCIVFMLMRKRSIESKSLLIWIGLLAVFAGFLAWSIILDR